MIFVLRSSSPVCKLGAEIGNKTGILDYSPPTTAINAIHTTQTFLQKESIISRIFFIMLSVSTYKSTKIIDFELRKIETP